MISSQTSESLVTQALSSLSNRLEKTTQEKYILPSEWLENHFYIPEPRDLITGKITPPGPIRLAPIQKRIIDEALSRDDEGMLKYTTVVYSCPKKSGKSAVASGVTLYMADQNPFSFCYCLGNDGKSANDRIYRPIKTCFSLHRKLGGKFSTLKYQKVEVLLPNGTKIEAIPCDAQGEAGSEPLMVTITEAWGWDTDGKIQLYTEMCPPPTKFGRAIRWIESYAGFIGVSEILERLYRTGVKEGEPHPDFEDLSGRDGEPVVWVNEKARMLCYWDTVPRMVWQTEEFYVQQALDLPPSEFARVHQNQWVSPIGAYIQSEWWDACASNTLPPLTDSRTAAVVAVDAATENDCAAIVLVTRHPDRPETDVAVRDCRIFKSRGHNDSIILSKTIGRVLQEWGEKYHIVCVAYDAYQMKKMAQDYRRGLVEVDPAEIVGLNEEEIKALIDRRRKAVSKWYYEFSQHAARAQADKLLYDMIVARQIEWPTNTAGFDLPCMGNTESLSKHIKQAGVKTTAGQYRIVRLATELKVDAAVALSMATDRCMALIIGNRESTPKDSEEKYQRGEIDYETYIANVAGRMRKEDG